MFTLLISTYYTDLALLIKIDSTHFYALKSVYLFFKLKFKRNAVSFFNTLLVLLVFKAHRCLILLSVILEEEGGRETTIICNPSRKMSCMSSMLKPTTSSPFFPVMEIKLLSLLCQSKFGLWGLHIVISFFPPSLWNYCDD